MTPEELSALFLSLAGAGAHNINLVTPTHFARPIARALSIAKGIGENKGTCENEAVASLPNNCLHSPLSCELAGYPLSSGLSTNGLSANRLSANRRLAIPIVYNSSGYESVETLRMLEGLVDVYLPDMKYSDPATAAELSDAPDYPETAAAAILEMTRQTGPARYDSDGLMTGGVLVRHLVLPGHVANSLGVIDWIADNLPPDVPISLMSQYTPPQPCPAPCPTCAAAPKRKLTAREFAKAEARLYLRGRSTGYVQALDSADAAYIPAFTDDRQAGCGRRQPE